MKVFFTKKQKKLMRERRKKKRVAERQAKQDDETPVTGVEVDEPTATIGDKGEATTASPATSSKRPRESLDSSVPTLGSRIIIPSNLSPKDVKKFRKDTRRQARSEGLDEAKLVFLTEREEASQKTAKRRKRSSFPRLNDLAREQKKEGERNQQEKVQLEAEVALPDEIKQRYVALDCEMVGVGTTGRQSALARASLTDWDGNVLMDSFVQVSAKVTDFRTQYSGVEPKHLKSKEALTIEECRQAVTRLLNGRILVGHALKNDLDALMLTHPPEDTRDTAKYRPYQRWSSKWRPRKLRDLAAEHCQMTIQRDGESHDSVDDARAAMSVFKVSRVAWEAALERKQKKGR
jgi:RNA exonuclease 4